MPVEAEEFSLSSFERFPQNATFVLRGFFIFFEKDRACSIVRLSEGGLRD